MAPSVLVASGASPPRDGDVTTVEAEAETALLRNELRRQGFFGEDLERIVVVGGLHTARRIRHQVSTLQGRLEDAVRAAKAEAVRVRQCMHVPVFGW